jgi:hypothetical protein
MANNRLYLYDPEEGDKFLLAKGWGDGWAVWGGGTGNERPLEDRLQEWLDARDVSAAYNMERTTLRLITEADPESD